MAGKLYSRIQKPLNMRNGITDTYFYVSDTPYGYKVANLLQSFSDQERRQALFKYAEENNYEDLAEAMEAMDKAEEDVIEKSTVEVDLETGISPEDRSDSEILVDDIYGNSSMVTEPDSDAD